MTLEQLHDVMTNEMQQQLKALRKELQQASAARAGGQDVGLWCCAELYWPLRVCIVHRRGLWLLGLGATDVRLTTVRRFKRIHLVSRTFASCWRLIILGRSQAIRTCTVQRPGGSSGNLPMLFVMAL